MNPYQPPETCSECERLKRRIKVLEARFVWASWCRAQLALCQEAVVVIGGAVILILVAATFVALCWLCASGAIVLCQRAWGIR